MHMMMLHFLGWISIDSISALLTLFSPRVFHIFFGMENLHQLLAIAAFLMMTTSSGCVLCVFTVAFVAFVQNAAFSVNFLEGKPM